MSERSSVLPNLANWPIVTLSQACKLIRRGTAPTYVDASDVYAIGQRCVTRSDFNPQASRPHSARAISGVLRPEPGDVLFNSTGTGTIGRSVVFPHTKTHFIVDGHVTLVRPTADKLTGKWLNELFRNPSAQAYLESHCYSGSTNQVELSTSTLTSMPLAIPPVEEQRRIAEILDTIDDQIRATEQVIAKLKIVKQGILEDLLTMGLYETGKLRSPRHHPEDFHETTVGPRPKAWQVARLGDFLDSTDYGISTSLSDSGEVPVLRMNNFLEGEAAVTDLKFSDSAEAAKLLLRPGDVLFNRTNSLVHVGRTGIWRGQIDRVSFASYLVRLNPNPLRLRSEYLNRLLNRRQTQIDIRRWATPGVHQVNVNPTNLRKVIVAVPDSLSEQDGICKRLSGQDDLIAHETRTLLKLKHQKAGLMADLLTGKVRVETVS